MMIPSSRPQSRLPSPRDGHKFKINSVLTLGMVLFCPQLAIASGSGRSVMPIKRRTAPPGSPALLRMTNQIQGELKNGKLELGEALECDYTPAECETKAAKHAAITTTPQSEMLGKDYDNNYVKNLLKGIARDEEEKCIGGDGKVVRERFNEIARRPHPDSLLEQCLAYLIKQDVEDFGTGKKEDNPMKKFQTKLRSGTPATRFLMAWIEHISGDEGIFDRFTETKRTYTEYLQWQRACPQYDFKKSVAVSVDWIGRKLKMKYIDYNKRESSLMGDVIGMTEVPHTTDDETRDFMKAMIVKANLAESERYAPYNFYNGSKAYMTEPYDRLQEDDVVTVTQIKDNDTVVVTLVKDNKIVCEVNKELLKPLLVVPLSYILQKKKGPTNGGVRKVRDVFHCDGDQTGVYGWIPVKKFSTVMNKCRDAQASREWLRRWVELFRVAVREDIQSGANKKLLDLFKLVRKIMSNIPCNKKGIRNKTDLEIAGKFIVTDRLFLKMWQPALREAVHYDIDQEVFETRKGLGLLQNDEFKKHPYFTELGDASDFYEIVVTDKGVKRRKSKALGILLSSNMKEILNYFRVDSANIRLAVAKKHGCLNETDICLQEDIQMEFQQLADKFSAHDN